MQVGRQKFWGTALVLLAVPVGACAEGQAVKNTLAPTGGSQTADVDGGNRIEVSGNTARRVGCNASVNSVEISGAHLQGRTIIVQGRNARDVRAGDCTDDMDGCDTPASVNSVRIR